MSTKITPRLRIPLRREGRMSERKTHPAQPNGHDNPASTDFSLMDSMAMPSKDQRRKEKNRIRKRHRRNCAPLEQRQLEAMKFILGQFVMRTQRRLTALAEKNLAMITARKTLLSESKVLKLIRKLYKAEILDKAGEAYKLSASYIKVTYDELLMVAQAKIFGETASASA